MTKHSRTLPYWLIFGSGLILANLAYFVPPPFGWIVTLGFFLFAPGYLSLQFIARTSWSRWETLSFSLGLSLLFLMLAGLALNGLGYAGVHAPLSALNTFIALDLGVALLLVANLRSTLTISFDFNVQHLTWRRLVGSLLFLLPLGAAAGAIRLNNGTDGTVTLIIFAIIAVAFVLLMLRSSLQRYYPLALFLFALSILLSVSLRGWEITGHDIQREFNVFQLTMQQGMWNIAQFRDPYNACLSITLLPTLLAKITGIPDAYIFKVVFQFIAAFAVIPAYFFVRRLHGPRDALLAGFIFLLFPTFLNDMAMLNRQEIAFLFFGLIMLLMLLSVGYRRLQILTVLLLIGLTLSHYSSSYIMIGLMLTAWIVNIAMTRLTKPRFATENANIFPIMTLPVIIFAGIFVFTWNDQITQTTKGLNSTVTKTLANFGIGDKESAQATDVSYSLLGGKSKSPQEVIDAYSTQVSDGSVKATAVAQPSIPVTAVGSALGGEHILQTIHGLIRNSIAKILQILIVIGCIVLWWRIKRHRHRPYDLYVLSLCGGSTLLLIALTILPQLSVDYGVLRLFQQLLIVLSLPIIAGMVWLFTFISKNVSVVYGCIAGFFAIIFLHTSGFIPQITGGYTPQLSLNNSGFYYDAYYVVDDQRQAATWMCDYLQKDPTPKAYDVYAKLRIGEPCLSNMVSTSPMSDYQHAYVYRYGPNVSRDAYMANINSNLYYYTLDEKYQSDMIYDNGKADILHSDRREK